VIDEEGCERTNETFKIPHKKGRDVGLHSAETRLGLNTATHRYSDKWKKPKNRRYQPSAHSVSEKKASPAPRPIARPQMEPRTAVVACPFRRKTGFSPTYLRHIAPGEVAS